MAVVGTAQTVLAEPLALDTPYPAPMVEFHLTRESYQAGDFDAAADRAVNDGLVVRVATWSELFLDLDTPEMQMRFLQLLPFLEKNFKVKGWSAVRSRNRNIHVIVEMGEPLLEMDRIALQTILGSDPKKEMSAVRRSLNGIRDVVRLFQPPEPEDTMAEMKQLAAEIRQ